MNYREIITIESGKRGGRPCIRGMRITVYDVLGGLANGMTNEQIANRLGFRDRRAVSRTNGQIYAAWGLDNSTEDEKTARARAALIFTMGRMIIWDEDGTPRVRDAQGKWLPLFKS